MATMTAQILIGTSHTWHGGIIPDYRIYLSENDRPALILTSEEIYSGNTVSIKKIVWIPAENWLDDILLMISAIVLKNEKIIELLNKNRKSNLEYLELYKEFDLVSLNNLYAENKKIINEYKGLKVIFSIFQDSSLSLNIKRLKSYKFQYELCTSQ